MIRYLTETTKDEGMGSPTNTDIDLYEVSSSAETLWGHTASGEEVLISGTLLYGDSDSVFKGSVTKGPKELLLLICKAHIDDTQARVILTPPKITGDLGHLFSG